MKLAQIPISRVIPNRNNPRRIDIKSEDDKLSYLMDSIRQFGVMVPVVVTRRGRGFFLIDGERRYHAAKAVGLRSLPAYILQKEDGRQLTTPELLYRMFQIHHLREQWGAIQQCFALEETYAHIARRPTIRGMQDDRKKFNAVVRALAERTGIDTRTASDRAKFLRWPQKVKDSLYAKPEAGAYSYILEIEDKIILPALSNYPEYFRQVPVDEVRLDLFRKLNASLAHAQEVRQLAPYFRTRLGRASDQKRVTAILGRLAKNVSMTYEDAHEELQKAFPDILPREPPSPKRLLSMLESLDTALQQFDPEAIKAATRRARASASELSQSAQSVLASLTSFIEELGETKR